MKPDFAVALLLLLSLAVPVRTSAQLFGSSVPEVRGVFNPVVGSGASYQSVGKDGKKERDFEITVVDKDPSGGYWMEFSIPEKDGTVYMKYLISRQGDGAIIQHTIYQAPGQPPVDTSKTMSTQGMQDRKHNQKLDFRAEAQNLGNESVTTPGGTFSCQHWRTTKEGTDIWLSDKVTPWGLVKMSGSQVGTVTLSRVITGAKTHITGAPISLEEMMRKQMK